MARCIRLLIYQGPEEWLDATLSSPARYVDGVRILGTIPHRSIAEVVVPGALSEEILGTLMDIARREYPDLFKEVANG